MKELNFIAGGLMGDFIHSLAACKNICLKEKAKANLYISNGYFADPFRYGVEKAYKDTYEMIDYQDYISSYKILEGEKNGDMINLNLWRKEVHKTYAEIGCYNKNWTTLLSDTFSYKFTDYKWLSVPPIDSKTNGRILIHRSRQRHNSAYPDYIKSLTEQPLFITTSISEYELYEFKHLCEVYLVNTITEMAIAIASCKLFIGNQSSPFALASALDINRVCELDNIDAYPFYLGEDNYSKNIKFIQQ